MKASSTLGLRDKKREETRSRLERAAVTLVERQGLVRTTIDAISDAADVSPRTFFNYFETKEDAVLGVRDVELTNELVAEHIAQNDGAGLAESVVRLLISIMGPSIGMTDLHALRMRIVQQHPELLSRHISQMTRMADQLITAVVALLKADRGVLAGDGARTVADAELTAQAEVLLTLCSGGVRVAVKEWVAAGSTTFSEQLESRAISLVREVTKNIS